jgi:hypothetical protein
MPHHRATAILYSTIFFAIVAISLCANSSQATAQDEESLEGFTSGLRSNAVKGQVAYQRGDGKFDLEPGLKFEEGDFIKTGRDSYAELLLQPGNYLRIGSETDFQIFSDQADRMRLKLNQGTIAFEILAREPNSFSSFFYSRAQMYELLRVITPNASVYVTQTGIFRINALAGDRTELIVREGEAVINGHRVKKKRRAVSSGANVTITEIDAKVEDAFDQWGRERAQQLVQANRALKKDSAWARKRREGEETTVQITEDEDQQKNTTSLYVVSAKPGTVAFVEPGVQFTDSETGWQELTDKTGLETGSKVRTDDLSFVELVILPDMHLRLNANSEVAFEQLSNESISIKLLRGSAILDVARFDRKRVPQIKLAGPTLSVVVADEGNYRFDVIPKGDQVIVREGKVTFKDRSFGSCNRIELETISDCSRKRHDNFDFWSEHRGEGSFFYRRNYVSQATLLARIRRARFRNTGFWFQNPGQPHYTFVPFTSTLFKSPYGGNYSTVLTPRRPGMNRIYIGGGVSVGRSGPLVTRP